jgi:tetratricopeptide (TPR) repeat protein
METIKSLQPLLVTALIVLALLFFRGEVKKLVGWIVSFKKLSKTKNGYQALAEPEPSAVLPEPKGQLSGEKALQKIENTEHKEEERKQSWIEAYSNNDYDKAIELLKDDLETETNAHRKDLLRAFVGAVKFKKDKKTGAEYFEDLIREQGPKKEAYYWYAFSFFQREDYETAIAVAKKGFDAPETWPDLHELCADCLVSVKREIEAIELLAENLNRYPETASPYVKIADILIRLGMKDLARDCCRTGIAFCPTDVGLLEKYAGILNEMEEYKEAMTIYLKLTNMKPEEPKYWTFLGNQCLMLSLNDLAWEAYKKGNQLADEKQEWIIANIGNLMNNRGFYTEGARYLKRATEIDPDSRYAHEKLASALKSSQEERDKREAIAEEVRSQLRISGGRLDAVIKTAKERRPLPQ